jgi:predicted membrane metal-binding protein
LEPRGYLPLILLVFLLDVCFLLGFCGFVIVVPCLSMLLLCPFFLIRGVVVFWFQAS